MKTTIHSHKTVNMNVDAVIVVSRWYLIV